ncbi:MAG TPA: tetratricopeptide repeat protein [Kribbella sp.]
MGVRVDLARLLSERYTPPRKAVDLRRELVQLNREDHLPGLASAVNNLAIDLAGAGRRAEALSAAQEAVELYRKLTERNREVYRPLAERANNLLFSLDETA